MKTIFQKQQRAARRMTRACQRKGSLDTSMLVCESASIEEMFDFTGVISATSVNYSCVLIVWLELTTTTSSTEQKPHAQTTCIQTAATQAL